MKKVTNIQIITFFALLAYIIWEFYVWNWAISQEYGGAIIRVDLVIILPVLLVLIIVSLVQFFRKKTIK
ncbi:hypothetical protein DWB61_05830 [Ancylomarina euxinus]|uniref:Uncharacterized protein n=1 Tax=Ancylomarina euxinus TaxID=2283627 RepID=A0A425Y429_9BACT|nr:hypothetical protein [Ancylomarina euxinus]MCZ4694557.1 hypothetical protein [Ancylomarina euxinus]MUP14100.1 hypothetical protein [Ancylomarina euxinus]RRG22957.1 hypothetical protein DWB61_05830 [Ancylomarina euxinus]